MGTPVQPMAPAGPMDFNSYDFHKWIKDVMVFASVPALFYITAVLANLQAPGHVLAWSDFAPNNVTMISIISWVLNQLVNLLKKFVA